MGFVGRQINALARARQSKEAEIKNPPAREPAGHAVRQRTVDEPRTMSSVAADFAGLVAVTERDGAGGGLAAALARPMVADLAAFDELGHERRNHEVAAIRAAGWAGEGAHGFQLDGVAMKHGANLLFVHPEFMLSRIAGDRGGERTGR